MKIEKIAVRVIPQEPVVGPTSVKITLPYPPTANNFKVPARNGRGMVLTQQARDYKKNAADLLFLLRDTLPPQPWRERVHVTFHVYRPRKVGDLCNLEKIPIDCLTGIVFEDDSQIVELHAYLHDDKANPRVEILVEREW